MSAGTVGTNMVALLRVVDAWLGHGLGNVGAAVGALGQQVTRIYGGLNHDRKGNEIRV